MPDIPPYEEVGGGAGAPSGPGECPPAEWGEAAPPPVVVVGGVVGDEVGTVALRGPGAVTGGGGGGKCSGLGRWWASPGNSEDGYAMVSQTGGIIVLVRPAALQTHVKVKGQFKNNYMATLKCEKSLFFKQHSGTKI